jgi:hypothetical protein
MAFQIHLWTIIIKAMGKIFFIMRFALRFDVFACGIC